MGLNIYSNEYEIKQAYRKLALQFHPDKNPSKEAEAIFKEVNEAYEILGDPQSKFQYDQLLMGVSPPQPPHRDPRYRPRPPGTYSRTSKRKEMLDTMRSYLTYALMASRLALLFSCILIADYSLPPIKTEQQIVNVRSSLQSRGPQSSQLELQKGETINLSAKAAREFQRGSVILLHRTAWFSIPLTLENEKSHFKTKVPVSIYGNFIFLPLVLLITSLLGTFFWKGVEFRFNLGVVNFFLMLLSFIFLRIHSF